MCLESPQVREKKHAQALTPPGARRRPGRCHCEERIARGKRHCERSKRKRAERGNLKAPAMSLQVLVWIYDHPPL